MMDPGSIIGAAGTVATGVDLAQKGWGWWKTLWNGKISITSPQYKAIVHPEWVPVEGVHKNAKGTYWLVTHDGDKYWPQAGITRHPDGSWSQRVNVNKDKGPRPCFLILAWTSEFMDSIFRDFMARGNKTNHWGPLNIKPPTQHFQIVQEIVLQVRDGPQD